VSTFSGEPQSSSGVVASDSLRILEAPDSVVRPPHQFSSSLHKSELTELASGVGALYLSGRASIPLALVDELEAVRADAVLSGQPVTFHFGDEQFAVAPHDFQRYRFCLDNLLGRVGISTSSHLLSFRIQPRAEFLHGLGAQGVVDWCP